MSHHMDLWEAGETATAGLDWSEPRGGLIYSLAGLCCHNWPNPLCGLPWVNVLNELTLSRLIQPQPARGVLSFWCGVWLKPVFACFQIGFVFKSERMCVRSCIRSEHGEGDWKDIVIASCVDCRTQWLKRKLWKVGSAMKQRSRTSLATSSPQSYTLDLCFIPVCVCITFSQLQDNSRRCVQWPWYAFSSLSVMVRWWEMFMALSHESTHMDFLS